MSPAIRSVTDRTIGAEYGMFRLYPTGDYGGVSPGGTGEAFEWGSYWAICTTGDNLHNPTITLESWEAEPPKDDSRAWVDTSESVMRCPGQGVRPYWFLGDPGGVSLGVTSDYQHVRGYATDQSETWKSESIIDVEYWLFQFWPASEAEWAARWPEP